MDYIKTIQCSIDYIEENLKKDLTIEKIAEKTSFSPYHFYRLFHAYIGMPVMQYVRRRLLHAIHALACHGTRIIDIAMEYGFKTHSGFSKAFHKEFGCSPSQYILNINDTIPKKIDLMLHKKYNLKNGVVMEPKIVTRPALRWLVTILKLAMNVEEVKEKFQHFGNALQLRTGKENFDWRCFHHRRIHPILCLCYDQSAPLGSGLHLYKWSGRCMDRRRT